MEAFRESKVFWGSCWWSASICKAPCYYFWGFCKDVRSKRPTSTIWTPWRPPWRPSSRTCPGKRLRFCWWTAPPCNPLDYYFFESLQMNYQQESPKHFGLPEGLHGGPIPEHAQGWEYARLVPLPLYNPPRHRGRGWLHLIFFDFILFYILLLWNTRKIKKKTLLLSVWERFSFSANLLSGPCIIYIRQKLFSFAYSCLNLDYFFSHKLFLSISWPEPEENPSIYGWITR